MRRARWRRGASQVAGRRSVRDHAGVRASSSRKASTSPDGRRSVCGGEGGSCALVETGSDARLSACREAGCLDEKRRSEKSEKAGMDTSELGLVRRKWKWTGSALLRSARLVSSDAWSIEMGSEAWHSGRRAASCTGGLLRANGEDAWLRASHISQSNKGATCADSSSSLSLSLSLSLWTIRHTYEKCQYDDFIRRQRELSRKDFERRSEAAE